MKNLSFILLFVLVAHVGYGLFDGLKSVSEAYRAYQDQATPIAISRRGQAPFDSIEGYIANVTYVLQSVEAQDENTIVLVAVQAVHFKRSLGPVSLGDRKIAKTQHRVLMIKEGGSWLISELEEGVTEISSLRDAFRTEINPEPRFPFW